MGAHLGQSGGCPFAEHTDRKLTRIVAETSASTDRGLRVSPCPLEAGTAPLEAAQTPGEHAEKLEPSGAF